MKYTITNISTLLPPLQNAIALACWDDAEDLAREISKMCRIKRLEELQAIHEAVAGSHESNRVKTSAGGISAPKSPPSVFKTEAYRPSAVTIETKFDEFGHTEPWRNEVATELNWIVGLAKARQHVHEIDHFAHAALSIASRVAEFEQIQVIRVKD